jgi:hypothetical protein
VQVLQWHVQRTLGLHVAKGSACNSTCDEEFLVKNNIKKTDSIYDPEERDKRAYAEGDGDADSGFGAIAEACGGRWSGECTGGRCRETLCSCWSCGVLQRAAWSVC